MLMPFWGNPDLAGQFCQKALIKLIFIEVQVPSAGDNPDAGCIRIVRFKFGVIKAVVGI
jgi:hypothetical protein